MHVAVPLAFNSTPAGGSQRGLGDVELGVKYRFFRSTDDKLMAAVYPTVLLPTGNATRGLGNGQAQILLPVWLQKSEGLWTWDAGAGYLVNRANDARNSWYFGLLARRTVNEHLSVGAELFRRTALAQDLPTTSGFNVGVTMELAERRNLLVSLGRGLQGEGCQSIFVLRCLSAGPIAARADRCRVTRCPLWVGSRHRANGFNCGLLRAQVKLERNSLRALAPLFMLPPAPPRTRLSVPKR
jgi:hypothetical protein